MTGCPWAADHVSAFFYCLQFSQQNIMHFCSKVRGVISSLVCRILFSAVFLQIVLPALYAFGISAAMEFLDDIIVIRVGTALEDDFMGHIRLIRRTFCRDIGKIFIGIQWPGHNIYLLIKKILYETS